MRCEFLNRNFEIAFMTPIYSTGIITTDRTMKWNEVITIIITIILTKKQQNQQRILEYLSSTIR